MSTWRTIYRYELKKILQKRFTILTMLLIYIFLIVAIGSDIVGDVYVDGVQVMSQTQWRKLQQANNRALSGRRIEEGLLREAAGAWQEYLAMAEELGSSPTQEERERLADTNVKVYAPYAALIGYCQKAVNRQGGDLLSLLGEKDFYEAVDKNLQAGFERNRLEEGEIAWWKQKQKQLERPVTYRYDEGYARLLSMVYALSLLLMLLYGVALSGVFSEERSLGCEQLLLTTRYGYGTLYFAKLAAGLTFVAASMAVVILLSIGMVFAIYGCDGFTASLALYRPLYPYPVSIGWFTLMQGGIFFVTLLLVSLLILFLSVCFRRSIIPLAVVFLRLMMGLFFSVPKGMRVLSQLWTLLPINYLFADNAFDLRLLSLGGHYLTSWQVMPFVYLGISIAVVLVGKRVYGRIS